MAEYTYEDIIMDPNDPRLEGAIGKECYFSDYPKNALDYARNNSTVDRLKSINKELACPFVGEHKASWAVVIIKKEEPKKYVPFESIEEFVERYTEVKEGTEFGTFEDNLLQCGMWIKSKDDDDLSQVTVIREYGICIDTMSTFVLWKNLLDDFEFIDGTPCGKLEEESNA